MKYPVIIFVLLFLIKTTIAQSIETPNNKGMIDNILTVKPKTLKMNLPQARFLFNTDKGKVYALPQDNIPCLVPNINSNMPIAKLPMNRYEQIPNAMPKQQLIPETGTLINPLKKK